MISIKASGKLKVLLITGKLASSLVKSILEANRDELALLGIIVDVYVANSDVAALIPYEEIEKAVKYARDVGFNMVMIPGTHGLGRNALEELSRRYGVLVVKGPRDAYGIPQVLKEVVAKLASIKPGDTLELSYAQIGVEEFKRLRERLLENSLQIRCGLRLPIRPPPLQVFGEIYVDESMSVEEVVRLATNASKWCSLLVIGVPHSFPVHRAIRIVEAIKDKIPCIGLDSASQEVIESTIRHLSLVMSIGPEDEYMLKNLPEGLGVVLIPASPGSRLPELHERVSVLRELALKAYRLRLVPIVDPILRPPMMGLAESLEAYMLASKTIDVPILAGIGNVYELIDADSHGVIAVLVALLAEIGVSVLLASEVSRKARGAVFEALMSSLLASLSLKPSKPPKDLGLDLLVVKEKREKKPAKQSASRVVDAWTIPRASYVEDPAGSLTIWVEDGLIHVTLMRNGVPVITLRARSAEEAYRAAIALGMVSRLDHAAYMGKELAYAELALRLGKSYVQEESPIRSLQERYANLAEKYVKMLRGEVYE